MNTEQVTGQGGVGNANCEASSSSLLTSKEAQEDDNVKCVLLIS